MTVASGLSTGYVCVLDWVDGGYDKLLLDAGPSPPGGLHSLETSRTSSRIQAVARQLFTRE
jgi:hypothetical protein